MTTRPKILECTEKYRLEHIEKDITEINKEIKGNGDPGLHDVVLKSDEKLNAIIKRQDNTWKWAVPLAIFLLGNMGWSIVDHYKVNNFPQDYVSKKYYDMYVNELRNEVKIILNSKLETKKDVLTLQEKLINNDTLFNYLKVTRSATQKNKK
jgi:hypothetical protein